MAKGRFGPVEGAEVEGRWAATPGEVRVEGLSASSSVGGVEEVAATLAWSQGLRLAARGRARGFDLRPFMGLFVRGWFPVGLRATGPFEAEGPLAPELGLGFRVDCTVEGLDVTTRPGDTPVYAMPSAGVTAEGVVGKRELTIAAGRIRAGDTQIQLARGRIAYREGLWFDTDVSFGSLSAAGRWAPAGLAASGTARGRFGGPYRNLEFAYEVDAEAGYRGESLGRVRATLRLDYGGVRFDRLDWTPAWGRVEASGELGWGDGRGLDLLVRGREIALSGLARSSRSLGWGAAIPVDGTAEVEARISGSLRAPEVRGRIEAGGLRVLRFAVDRASVPVRATPEGWEAGPVRARAYGGAVTGTVRGGREGFAASARVEGLKIGPVLADAGVRGPPDVAWGAFQGTVSVEGPYREPRV
ncbi:MAG: hypothetical protein D6708_16650, partial [Candidatus Dadabacteria bacterium]